MGVQGLNTVEFWRARADEARAVANGMRDPEARAILLTIADKYEAQVDRLSSRAAHPPFSAHRDDRARLLPSLSFGTSV